MSEEFELIDGISDLSLRANRLKAVTTAFDSVFTANIKEISKDPDYFYYLFDTIHEQVLNLAEKAEALVEKSGEYLHRKE